MSARLRQRLSAGLVLVAATAACGRGPESTPPAAALRVSTAFTPFSSRLTEEYRRTLPDVTITEVRSAFSSDGLSQIQAGTLDFVAARGQPEAMPLRSASAGESEGDRCER